MTQEAAVKQLSSAPPRLPPRSRIIDIDSMSAIKHTPAVKFEDIPGSLPISQVPKGTDNNVVAHHAVELLNNLQKDNLASNIIWRDLLSFTDNLRTFYSPDLVFDTFQQLSSEKRRSAFSLSESTPRLIASGDLSWLDVDVNFSTRDGDLVEKSAGTVSLAPDPNDDKWRIWMLRTWLENYDGHGHPDEPGPVSVCPNPRVNGVTNGTHQHIYDVVIVGGGQAGIGTAGRCKALGVDYVLFDERPAIGDSWTHRYDSLKWHTIKEYGNLPFGRTFLPEDDELLTKDRIGSGYKEWSEKFGLNTRSSIRVDHAQWDAATQLWTVYTGAFGQDEWKTKDLVLCIGGGHKTSISPEWASEAKLNSSGFKGTLMHAADWRNAHAWAGKRGVVVGTANSGNDVAEDMANAGMKTTMLQRNPTFIFPGDWLVAAEKQNYHLGKPTEQADREDLTRPLKISRELTNRGVWAGIKKNPERFDALENAGFKVDRFGDLFSHLYIRFGGHYIDIGACDRIVKGEIEVITTSVKGLTETGLEFEDGSKLDADLIVCATGFEHKFRQDAAEIVGWDIAEQMDDYWGVDKEGELRGWARLAGHPHLFYFGGEVRSARFFSRFLALQLQKRKLGGELKPYTA